MITEQKQPKRIATTLGLSSNWNKPASFSEWSFTDLVNCPNLDEALAAAPSVERVCPKCGDRERANAIQAAVAQGLACDKCYQEFKKEPSKPYQAASLGMEEIIPPLFRQTDRARLEKETSSEQIYYALQWELKAKGKGLVLVGDTRTGKTRTLCLLLGKLIREGHQVRAFFHGSFSDGLVEVMRSERSYRAWKRKVTQASLLVIDDLFSEKLTERCEASLFEILDERICNYRPTLITTQVTKREGLKRFHSLKRAEAFYARINEFFQIIPCGKPDQQSLKV